MCVCVCVCVCVCACVRACVRACVCGSPIKAKSWKQTLTERNNLHSQKLTKSSCEKLGYLGEIQNMTQRKIHTIFILIKATRGQQLKYRCFVYSFKACSQLALNQNKRIF